MTNEGKYVENFHPIQKTFMVGIYIAKKNSLTLMFYQCIDFQRGHYGRVVTLSPPTSKAEVRFPAWPQVGKLGVACHLSAVFSTEP